MSSNTPLKTSQSRVFLIEGRARPTHSPSYESCLRMTGLSQGQGDIEKIECPDPESYSKFIEVASIKGATERVTTTLEGRFAMTLLSTLAKLANRGCAMDVQLHIGDCQDPRIFTAFRKVVILEDVYPTNYGTDELGALASGDDAVVNETMDISAREFYEVVPLSFAEKAQSVILNELVDVVICDNRSCGDCEQDSDGCNKIYAVSKAVGGSPATLPDIVFSLDGGVTWYSHDIDSITASGIANGVDCFGAYIVVVSNLDRGVHYVLKSNVTNLIDPVWTKVATGVNSGLNALKSVGSVIFIVGDFGYIYSTIDPTTGVTVLDAGAATIANNLAVDALSSSFAVTVGSDGSIVKTEDGVNWSKVTTSPVGIGTNLNTVLLMNESWWFIGTSTGYLYATEDGGVTWVNVPFPGYGAGVVQDIVSATDSVLYLSHTTAATKGRILRSIDGGKDWVVMPDTSGTLPVSDRITRLAACQYDPNFVVGVGLADNGTDGIAVIGNGA